MEEDAAIELTPLPRWSIWKVDHDTNTKFPLWWWAYRARRIPGNPNPQYEREQIRRMDFPAGAERWAFWLNLQEGGSNLGLPTPPKANAAQGAYQPVFKDKAEGHEYLSRGRYESPEDIYQNLQAYKLLGIPWSSPAAVASQIGRAGAATAIPSRSKYATRVQRTRTPARIASSSSSSVPSSRFSSGVDQRIQPGMGVRHAGAGITRGLYMFLVLVVESSRFLCAPVYTDMEEAGFIDQEHTPFLNYVLLHTDREAAAALTFEELALLAERPPMRVRLFRPEIREDERGALILDLVSLKIEPQEGDEELEYEIVGAISRADLRTLSSCAEAVAAARDTTIVSTLSEDRAAPDEPSSSHGKRKAVRRPHRRR